MMKVRQQGFSLPEIMIVVVLLGVLVAGVMTSFTAQKKSASMNSQIVDVQQGTRLIGDLLQQDIRHAGMLVPESGALCGIDNDAAPDVFYVSDASALDPTDETRNDLGARIGGGVTNISVGAQTHGVDVLVLEFTTPTPAYDTDADGVADSDFRVGNGIIVTDAGNPSRGAACGTVTAVASAGPSLSFTIVSGVLGALPASPEVVDLVAIPAHEYRIDGGQLLRNGLSIAGDVEDLQIAVFIDDDEDRLVDVGEYRGNGVDADFNAGAVDISLAREVRANFVIRTRNEDLDNTNGRFQDAENRDGPVGADGFRRRAYSTTVMLRNVGSRLAAI